MQRRTFSPSLSGEFIVARINGTSGDDTLSTFRPGGEVIYGYRGNDILDLSVAGGAAYGGMGDDTFFGGGHGLRQSHMYGGAGADTFYLNTGNREAPYGDHVWGGDGHDQFHFTTSPADTARITGRIDDFDPSRDTLWLNGVKIDLADLPANVRIIQHLGQPWILIDGRILYALEGARQFDGAFDGDFDGDGQAIQFGNGMSEEAHFIPWPEIWADGVPASADMPYHDLYAYFPADQYNGALPEWKLTRHPYSGQSDEIFGTEGADWLFGDDGADTIFGYGGDDLIQGGEYDDLIYGGDGNDSISGGLDNDLIYGGAGNDVIYGGSGQDVIYGDDGDDFISGNHGNDLIYGGAGNDTLMGSWSNDTLYGGMGDDLLYATFPEAHLAAGYKQNAELYGGDGNDTLHTDPGGSTTVSGGAGEDRIVLEGDTPVQILDFQPGYDYLDLNGLSPGPAALDKNLVERIREDGGTDMVLSLSGAASIVFQGLSELDRGLILASMGQNQPIKPPKPLIPEIDDIPEDEEEADTSQDEEETVDASCFVATACFGGAAHPDVAWLRQFRNKVLRRRLAGRIFIRVYHITGPILAKGVRHDMATGRMMRRGLAWIVEIGRKRWPHV